MDVLGLGEDRGEGKRIQGKGKRRMEGEKEPNS